MTDTTPDTEPRWTLDEPALVDEAPSGDLEDCAGETPPERVEGMDGVELPDDDEVESVLGVPDNDETEEDQADG